MKKFTLISSGNLPENGQMVVSKDGSGRQFKSYFYLKSNGYYFKLFGSVFDHSNVAAWRPSAVSIDKELEYGKSS